MLLSGILSLIKILCDEQEKLSLPANPGKKESKISMQELRTDSK